MKATVFHWIVVDRSPRRNAEFVVTDIPDHYTTADVRQAITSAGLAPGEQEPWVNYDVTFDKVYEPHSREVTLVPWDEIINLDQEEKRLSVRLRQSDFLAIRSIAYRDNLSMSSVCGNIIQRHLAEEAKTHAKTTE